MVGGKESFAPSWATTATAEVVEGDATETAPSEPLMPLSRKFKIISFSSIFAASVSTDVEVKEDMGRSSRRGAKRSKDGAYIGLFDKFVRAIQTVFL